MQLQLWWCSPWWVTRRVMSWCVEQHKRQYLHWGVSDRRINTAILTALYILDSTIVHNFTHYTTNCTNFIMLNNIEYNSLGWMVWFKSTLYMLKKNMKQTTNISQKTEEVTEFHFLEFGCSNAPWQRVEQTNCYRRCGRQFDRVSW